MSPKDEKYRTKLSDQQYHVCWEQGTDRPYAGQYVDHFEPGFYHCVCCHQTLFSSQYKFVSPCGWPAFSETIDDDTLRYLEDTSHGMTRVEVRCGQCDAHLGHVFPDGPPPTGQRYCINSSALEFEPTVA